MKNRLNIVPVCLAMILFIQGCAMYTGPYNPDNDSAPSAPSSGDIISEPVKEEPDSTSETPAAPTEAPAAAESNEITHVTENDPDMDNPTNEYKGTFEKASYFLDRVYAESDSQNTIVSPLSLDMALGLVSGGAKGQTRDELSAYLEKDDYAQFAAEYMQYAEELNRDFSNSTMGGYKTLFEIANSVWVNEQNELVPEYADEAGKNFKAEIEAVSFAPGDSSNTVKTINSWCKEKTHDMIPSIVSEEDISEDLRAILINSLYFEAPWVESFGLSTDNHTFTDINGKKIEQPMLEGNVGCYYENEYATGFAKPYMNGLTFVGILPKNEGEFDVRDLDPESFIASERTGDVDVAVIMPKLDFETTSKSIIPILEDMGVKLPFDRTNADFTGLVKTDDGMNVYISDILQKCKIELDENGTKAAAVTALIAKEMMEWMPEEKEFKQVYLDRPFAFMIYDSVNEQIVFIGKVVTL